MEPVTLQIVGMVKRFPKFQRNFFYILHITRVYLIFPHKKRLETLKKELGIAETKVAYLKI